MSDNFYRLLNLPLKYLSWELRNELGRKLDTITALGNGWTKLASKLGYSAEDIEVIYNRRTKDSPSPTYLLLQDYETRRNGTIYELLRALVEMKHVAADVILDNRHEILEALERDRQGSQVDWASNGNNGYQNTERSSCPCYQCCIERDNNYTTRSESVFIPTGTYKQGYYAPGVENSVPLRAPPGARPREINESWIPPSTIPPTTTQTNIPPGHNVRGVVRMFDLQMLCEYCRNQADPEQTVLMTTSTPKKQCECGANVRPRPNHRQSPVGATSPDNSFRLSNRSSQGSDSPYSSLNDASLRSSNVATNGQNLGSNQHNLIESTDFSCRPKESRYSQMNNGKFSKKRNKGGDNDLERRSWPLSPCESNNVVRNSLSDSLLSVPRNYRRNQSEILAEQDSNTIYEIIYSRSPDSTIVYNNNLDTDDEPDVNQNISVSNSCNISRSTGGNQTDNISNPAPMFSPSNSTDKIKVFVTYAWNQMRDNGSFLDDVVELCRRLKNDANAKIKIDMDDRAYSSLRQNKYDWIDNNMREAKYIVVCITPTYADDILDQQQQQQPRVSQFNTRYVYDKLRAEYINNNSRNERVIPVIFSNYGTSMQHVPHCMRTTVLHVYPNNIDDIIKAVIGQGTYRPE
ncbi:SEFIR domain [Mactra antiquata]